MFGGVLPEIHRAWISIDHVLYLWNYSDGQQYEVYDALSELIIAVALVPARPGVFLEQTDWLLVVTTPTEVVALAVLFENSNDSCESHPVPCVTVLRGLLCCSGRTGACQEPIGAPTYWCAMQSTAVRSPVCCVRASD